MRRLFFIVMVCSLQVCAVAQVRMATYNIRADLLKDAPANTWVDRKAMVSGLIRFHDFDVFGVQEAKSNQLADLEGDLSDYTVVATDKRNGQNSSLIFFKSGKYSLLKSGHFWLSANPESEGKGWDAKYARSCTWVQLKDVKTNFIFFYFNTHMDHVGIEARRKSTALLLKKIAAIAGTAPAALCGDFNFSQHTENYQLLQQSGLLKDACLLAKNPYLPNGTFNGFNITRNSDERIDHIFLTRHFKVLRYGILTDVFAGKFPSDHFPVLIDVE
ncbi:endonuclease/exonuclease/phosphatase family protein [Pedobacter sp. AW31-3R]|uniref:endonuclease/exonuclease/phosphatase family protein n=1 Tax=Pedobacter sp. AW31-3R TaxID=3445781 RepID=UPI003FA185DF